MDDSIAPNPNLSPPSPSQALLLPSPSSARSRLPCCGDATSASGDLPVESRGGPFALLRSKIQLTTQFDSESSRFHHKVAWKVLNGLAKLKVSFRNNRRGEVACHQLGFHTKNLSVLYDIASNSTILKGSCDLAKNCLSVRATHDVKEHQGEVTMIASLGHPLYKLELFSFVPSLGLPRATIRFPLGEVSVKEKPDYTTDKVLSVSGILKGCLLNGVCTTLYNENGLNLRYCCKDAEKSFIPTLNLSSSTLACGLKRRFNPSETLSYRYYFDSSEWSAVYKHKVGKDIKLKAGYYSEAQIGWAYLLIGDEDGKCEIAPMKAKLELMLQAPLDDIRDSRFMFRVKKSWDF